ncbi:MAG: site-specific integrase [Candidatus Peribacteria bacterium]|jgi:integrase|nr:site-specific integrase [Candidatus Peribacteria bacterium]
MASIRKRGPYQWEVRIRKKGQPVTCKTFENKAVAEKWAREIETEMDRGIYVSRSEAENTTLSEALDRYIQEHVPKLSSSTSNRYLALVLKKRSIASKTLATIRSKDIADFIKEREAEGASGNTVRAYLCVFSKLFNLAIRDWGMESLQNPVARVSKPKPAKGRERRLEDGEEERLLSFATPEMQNIIRLALETAMRRGELANLTWDSINFERRTATLYETKNGETRTAPLSPQALEILRNIKAEQAEQAGQTRQTKRLFTLKGGRITQEMRKTCEKAGITNLRFHDLRHEATSRLFENTDLDLMEIRSITGHKTLQMLVRYTHLRTARLADRLAGAGRQAKADAPTKQQEQVI